MFIRYNKIVIRNIEHRHNGRARIEAYNFFNWQHSWQINNNQYLIIINSYISLINNISLAVNANIIKNFFSMFLLRFIAKELISRMKDEFFTKNSIIIFKISVKFNLLILFNANIYIVLRNLSIQQINKCNFTIVNLFNFIKKCQFFLVAMHRVHLNARADWIIL